MKKIFILITMVLLTFTGCTTDSAYIDTVKSMTFSDGTTVEAFTKEIIQRNEIFFGSNNNSTPEPLKWEIEGEHKSGKTVTASTKELTVRIRTKQDGDYISFDYSDFTVYNKSTKKTSKLKFNKFGHLMF